MTYFKDGTQYTYGATETALNVGWLDASVEFPTGDVDAEFLCRLKDICRRGVNRMRGLHYCNLCPLVRGNAGLPVRTRVTACDGAEYVVGGAEIRVPGLGGEVFAAPDMIAHYVDVHSYRPPNEFIAAVMSTPDA